MKFRGLQFAVAGRLALWVLVGLAPVWGGGRGDFDEELELQRLVELEVAPEIPGRENRDSTTNTGATNNISMGGGP